MINAGDVACDCSSRTIPGHDSAIVLFVSSLIRCLAVHPAAALVVIFVVTQSTARAHSTADISERCDHASSSDTGSA